MPEKKGLELIKEYALKPEFKDTSFVLCYGGEKRIGEEAVKNGAADYLTKPYTIQQFVDILRKVIK